MIQIHIKNHRAIVRKERSRLLASVAHLFVDIEQKVEEEIIRQIQEVFREKGIEADFTRLSNHQQPPRL